MSKPKINEYWYTLEGMVELSKLLQTDTAKEMTLRAAKEISKKYRISLRKAQDIFLMRFTLMIKKFMGDAYNEFKDDFRRHSYLFPMNYWPFPYCSVTWRKIHNKVQRFLRKIPGAKQALEPNKVKDPIPKIIILGSGYSAESLARDNKLATKKLRFSKDQLEWQEKVAHADYYYGIVAVSGETFIGLCNVWYFDLLLSILAYRDDLDTLVEEMLHNCADQIVDSPRYGKILDDAREHYWMNEYGEFPEKTTRAIIKISKKYICALKKDIHWVIKKKIKPSSNKFNFK